MELFDIMKARRSVRKYTGESIDDEKIRQILCAGFLSPRSRSVPSWRMIVVRNKSMLIKMAGCRKETGKMLKNADCAIVVVGNQEVSDVWTEDCAIAMANMHLMASGLGVGSCWIQGRLRLAERGEPTEEYLRNLLGFSENYCLEAILSLGMPDEKKLPHNDEETEDYLEKYVCWDKDEKDE